MTSPRKPFSHRMVAFFAATSRLIATPILIYTAGQYTLGVINKPAAEVLTQTLTALGVTLGLSAVCLSSTITNQRTLQALQYAGRHLLHASILLLQMLFLVFVKENITSPHWTGTTLKWFLYGVAVLVVVPATWCWNYALDRLNDELWTVWIEGLPAPLVKPEAAKPDA